MIYLKSKPERNGNSRKYLSTDISVENIILMATPKTSVSAVNNCDIVAEGPGRLERVKALGKSIKARSRMALVMIGGAAMAACGAEAQDADVKKVAFNDKAPASQPLKPTPVADKVEAVDDEWDLGFGDDLELEKAETAAEKAETAKAEEKLAAEKAETARKTKEAEASTAIREAAEDILN